MSILLGKARKFSSAVQGPVAVSGQDKDRTEQALSQSPLPPQQYQGLRAGPDISIEYEPNHAIPVDGSQKFLRSLSPFLIQVEPPLIYGNDPSLLDGNPKTGFVTDYGKAQRSGFASARQGIQNSGLVSLEYQSASVEQYVSKSTPMTTKPIPADVPSGGNRIGRPAIADLYVAVDIALQLSAAINTPPLVLLINPQSLSMAYNKIQQFQDRTRFGYVFQAWGEEQPKLQISAKCGAFIAGGQGVQYASKRDSAAWQNLMSAFHFYRNNGYIHDTVGKSNAHHLVGALSIHYDGWIYYGHMGSFSYTFEEGNQLGGIVFEMEFTVSLMVDTTKSDSTILPMRSPMANANDPRLYTQGRGGKAGTLTVGLDGKVDDRLFSQGKAPASWAKATGSNATVVGQKALPKGGGGFQPPSATPTKATKIPGQQTSLEPFKR